MNARLGLVLLSACLLTGCYVVPETGRKAFILPIVNYPETGATVFAELKAVAPAVEDELLTSRVNRIGQRLVEVAGADLPNARWEFVVFDTPDMCNAFALPGGKVGVFSGILEYVESDDELAAILAHEIAHATARHGAQRFTAKWVAAAAGVALGIGSRKSNAQLLLLGGYGISAAASLRRFSRSHEHEADFIGLHYAAKAGYDPRAAIDFWRRAGKLEEGNSKFALLNTHPSNAQRIQRMEALLPSVIPLYEAARAKMADPVMNDNPPGNAAMRKMDESQRFTKASQCNISCPCEV